MGLERNQIQKRIISALLDAPATALRELIRNTQGREEIDFIFRFAQSKGIDLKIEKPKNYGCTWKNNNC